MLLEREDDERLSDTDRSGRSRRGRSRRGSCSNLLAGRGALCARRGAGGRRYCLGHADHDGLAEMARGCRPCRPRSARALPPGWFRRACPHAIFFCPAVQAKLWHTRTMPEVADGLMLLISGRVAWHGASPGESPWPRRCLGACNPMRPRRWFLAGRGGGPWVALCDGGSLQNHEGRGWEEVCSWASVKLRKRGMGVC